MNPDLERLQPYPFERLRALLGGIVPADLSPVALSIGEPTRRAPDAALAALTASLDLAERYPTTRGSDALREAIAGWLVRRFGLDDPAALAERGILPLNGTREGLFSIAQCLLDRSAAARDVLMPNPFYQIYEGAALMAGCRPALYAIDERADDNLDAIEDAAWDACQLVYVCTPGNPTGAVLSQAALGRLIERAHRHDFTIVSDECYSEIYRESAGAPPGLLQASHAIGNADHARCLAFHSLSKRSNLPGLRSGFVAGDAHLLERFAAYRAYHGCSTPGFAQAASIACWNDETHVRANRAAYDASYAAVKAALAPVVDVAIPPGGFYLWPRLPIDDELATRTLLEDANVRVVPGSYLARDGADGHNPGANRLRLALVAGTEDCALAATRIAASLAPLIGASAGGSTGSPTGTSPARRVVA